MEIEVVYLDGEHLILLVDPVIAAAQVPGLFPAQAAGAIAVIFRLRHKTVIP